MKSEEELLRDEPRRGSRDAVEGLMCYARRLKHFCVDNGVPLQGFR